ncbi:MAG: type II secretion system secretin GspD [Pseudomonadota bacterium]
MAAKPPTKNGRWRRIEVIEDSERLSTSRSRHLQKRDGQSFEVFTPKTKAVRTVGHTDGAVINLKNVAIPLAAKAVLSDILGRSFVVSDSVKGEITIQTSAPIPKEEALRTFAAALELSGARLIDDGDPIEIRSARDSGGLPLRSGSSPADAKSGDAIYVIPLKHVSASELNSIVSRVLPNTEIRYVGTRRHVIVARGSRKTVQRLLELVAMFDVSWIASHHVSLTHVRNLEPATVVETASKALSTGSREGGNSGLRLVPNNRLGGVLIIARTTAQLRHANALIEKLDRSAASTKPTLLVYHCQSRSPTEVGALLSRILSRRDTAPATASTAPRLGRPQSVSLSSRQSTSTDFGLNGSDEPDRNGAAPNGVRAPADASPSASTTPIGTADRSGGMKVVPDDTNNTLFVYAPRRDHDRIRRILERLDALPAQVLLEAIIAEVTLTDDLRYGVKWFFSKGKHEVTFTSAVSGIVNSSFPGFSYFFEAANSAVVLDALAEITKVHIVSSPSLMVLNNRKAILQIGDEVPIVTQTAQSVTDPDAPIVNSITQRDTGVILAVTPQIGRDGKIMLEIEQEVSNVTETTTSGIDSPTIRQRKVKTTVVVQDGQALALGGIIQTNKTVSKGQVPVLGNIPIVGSAFRNKDDLKDRTELVIFIRPIVVRTSDDRKHVTEEFRRRLEQVKPPIRRPMPKAVDDADRMVR